MKVFHKAVSGAVDTSFQHTKARGLKERERDTERKRERQTHAQRERDRQTETERKSDRERERAHMKAIIQVSRIVRTHYFLVMELHHRK